MREKLTIAAVMLRSMLFLRALFIDCSGSSSTLTSLSMNFLVLLATSQKTFPSFRAPDKHYRRIVALNEKRNEVTLFLCSMILQSCKYQGFQTPQRSYPWQSLVYGPKRRTFKALYSSSCFNRAEPYKAGRVWSVNLQEVLHTRMVLGIRQEGYFSTALANEVF